MQEDTAGNTKTEKGAKFIKKLFMLDATRQAHLARKVNLPCVDSRAA